MRRHVEVTQKVLDEIMAVRETGDTNMLDRQTVQFIADKMGFFRLVIWMEDNPKDYGRGILSGFKVVEE